VCDPECQDQWSERLDRSASQKHCELPAYAADCALLKQLNQELEEHRGLASNLRKFADHFKHRAQESQWQEVSMYATSLLPIFYSFVVYSITCSRNSYRSLLLLTGRLSTKYGEQDMDFEEWIDWFWDLGVWSQSVRSYFVLWLGLYQHWVNQSRYYLHTHWTESSNTIISILFSFLHEITTLHKVLQLFINAWTLFSHIGDFSEFGYGQ
jgi:hypothetical protein